MLKRRMLLGLLLPGVAVVVGMLVAGAFREREPEFGGKGLSQLLVDEYGKYTVPRAYTSGPVGDAHPSIRRGTPADQAVQHIGTRAIPYLLEWIRYEPPEARTKCVAITLEIIRNVRRLCGRRDQDEPDFRTALSYGAVGGFSSLRERAASAVPELAGLLKDTNCVRRSQRAAEALAFIGAAGFPSLSAVLTNPEPNSVRPAAIWSIAVMGTNARPAIPVLLECLKDPDNEVSGNASQTLAYLKLDPEVVVPALAQKLDSTNAYEKIFFMWLLSEFGNQARLALPAISRLLDDDDPGVRNTATNVLRELDKKDFMTEK